MPNITEKTEKHRVTLRVAGRFLTVLTDLPDERVRTIEHRINARLGEMAKANPRLATHDGRLDAALLLAVDLLSEADEQAERIGAMEGELRRARRALGGMRTTGSDAPAHSGMSAYPGMSREEKIERIRALLEAEKRKAKEGRA